MLVHQESRGVVTWPPIIIATTIIGVVVLYLVWQFAPLVQEKFEALARMSPQVVELEKGKEETLEFEKDRPYLLKVETEEGYEKHYFEVKEEGWPFPKPMFKIDCEGVFRQLPEEKEFYCDDVFGIRLIKKEDSIFTIGISYMECFHRDPKVKFEVDSLDCPLGEEVEVEVLVSNQDTRGCQPRTFKLECIVKKCQLAGVVGLAEVCEPTQKVTCEFPENPVELPPREGKILTTTFKLPTEMDSISRFEFKVKASADQNSGEDEIWCWVI